MYTYIWTINSQEEIPKSRKYIKGSLTGSGWHTNDTSHHQALSRRGALIFGRLLKLKTVYYIMLYDKGINHFDFIMTLLLFKIIFSQNKHSQFSHKHHLRPLMPPRRSFHIRKLINWWILLPLSPRPHSHRPHLRTWWPTFCSCNPYPRHLARRCPHNPARSWNTLRLGNATTLGLSKEHSSIKGILKKILQN